MSTEFFAIPTGPISEPETDREILMRRLQERTAAYEAKDGRQVRKIHWQEDEIEKLRRALDWALSKIPEGRLGVGPDEWGAYDRALSLVQPTDLPPYAEGDTCEMMLCEQNHLVLKPNQRYIFRVDPECAGCKKLAEIGNPNHT